MPEFDIQSFKSNFEGGARSYLFYYYPNIPGSQLGERASYLVKSSILPGVTLEEHNLSWQGHAFKFAGKHTFNDWTIDFNVDKDAKIRLDFENWVRNYIHNPETNEYGSLSDYMMDQNLELLGYNGQYILQYTLHNCWPKSVADVTVDYTSADVASFQVTFSFTHYSLKQQDNQTL